MGTVSACPVDQPSVSRALCEFTVRGCCPKQTLWACSHAPRPHVSWALGQQLLSSDQQPYVMGKRPCWLTTWQMCKEHMGNHRMCCIALVTLLAWVFQLGFTVTDRTSGRQWVLMVMVYRLQDLREHC